MPGKTWCPWSFSEERTHFEAILPSFGKLKRTLTENTICWWHDHLVLISYPVIYSHASKMKIVFRNEDTFWLPFLILLLCMIIWIDKLEYQGIVLRTINKTSRDSFLCLYLWQSFIGMHIRVMYCSDYTRHDTKLIYVAFKSHCWQHLSFWR